MAFATDLMLPVLLTNLRDLQRVDCGRARKNKITYENIRTRFGHMAERLVTLASQMPGFLGVESVRDANGLGITVSYWESEDAIRQWKAHSEHQVAQATGKNIWYADYMVRVAKVERSYGMNQKSGA
jgi:heme-degrading monooxygenase HmoA